MKNAVLIATAILMVITGCTHLVTRTGYKINPGAQNDTCQVRIFRGGNADTLQGKVVGRVTLGNSGYSIVCGEYEAMKIFKKEACNANADVVSIVEEQLPKSRNSCYQATALLIKTDGSQNSTPDSLAGPQSQIDVAAMEKRIKDDNYRNVKNIVLTVLIGVLVVSSIVVSLIIVPY